MTTETQTEPANIIDIPRMKNEKLHEANEEKAYEQNLTPCPCCGKAITNPKLYIKSIYGGCAYPSSDNTEYADAWHMAVGSECAKKFPKGYVFEQ